MIQTATQFVAQHAEYAKAMNPDMVASYGDVQAATIWAEGGEWPAYASDVVGAFDKPDVRQMEVDFENPGPIKSVANFLVTKFADTSVVGLTFECGAGKSTTVVQALYEAKLGKRVFVVEPSVIVSRKLSDYMTTKGVMCACLTSLDSIPSTRALLYTNAGVVFTALAKGLISSQDVVVIDEAHMASFMTGLLIKALAKFGMPVLMMTASTTPVIRGLRGVKLSDVSRMTAEISDALSREGERAVMVGVTESQSYAVPAAALIGATIDIRVIYDTGLRPEPKVYGGALIEGERRATTPEILQMVGRLGRTGKSGTAYYNRNAPVLAVEGISLYDILEKAISISTGLSKAAMTPQKASKIWQKSGILAAAKPMPTPVVTEASPPVGSMVSPAMVSAVEQQFAGIDMGQSGALHRTASVHRSRSRSLTLADGQSDARARSESRRRSRERVPPRGRSSSRASYTSASATLVPSVHPNKPDMVSAADLDTYDSSVPEARERAGSTSSLSSTGSRSSFHYKHESRRRYSRATGESERVSGALRISSCVVSDDGGQVVALAPDPGWRPFRREMSLYQGEIASNTGIKSMISRLDVAHSRGDLVYPAKFPKADPSITTHDSKREARLVLAKLMLPTFSELELLTVCVLWNSTVDACDGGRKPIEARMLESFLEYFRSYQAFDVNSA